MSAAVSRFLERLEAGESPEEILASGRPEAERALLRRCAVVRAFDRSLVDTVLAPDAGETTFTFEQLVAAPGVAPIPRTGGLYTLGRGEREAHWREWWSEAAPETAVPSKLEHLLKALVAYYEDAGRPLDRLAHLALIDPKTATTDFLGLYREADLRFDLAACQDLVDVLSEPHRERLLRSDLRRVRDDRAALLRARSLWSAEYFQTATFVEPARFLDVYSRLLGDTGARVLNVHAPGGLGKTTQLRALIARKLVPEQETPHGPPLAGGRVPCVRVDFDLVDPVNATRYPWLILLEAAAQLNDQLPRSPFKGLLGDFGWAVPLLRRNPSDPARTEVASKLMRSEGARASENVPREFSRTLAERLHGRPVLLVLDTLEEVHLRPQGDLAAPMKLLGSLLQDYPGIRLILSGRHPVREVLGRVADVLGAIDVHEVEPLSEAEAERYLDSRRGLDKTGVRAAIIENADGDPFVLALLADLVQEQPNIPPEEIQGYPADVIRLIRRIIHRIDERGVRWLLRYGAVPRTLSLPFVRDVMQPYLRLAMAGVSDYDPPGDDEVPDELQGPEPPFPADVLKTPQAPLDLDALWGRLRQYVVGSTGWVFEVKTGDPDVPVTLRFREDVAVPMRRLLRRKGVYRLLHRAAAEYYERRAREEDPERWDRWMPEALYHRFQLEGHRAERYWRRALDEAGSSPVRREAIAGELLESDYIDFRGDPLMWAGDEPMVAIETLVEARFEHAAALTERARLEGVEADDPLWSRAEQSRAAIDLVGKRVVPRFRLAYVDAGLELRHGDYAAAEVRLRKALTKARGHVDVARLRTLLGDALLMRGDAAALRAYREALAAISRLPASRGWQAAIRRRVVVAASTLDRLKEAYDEYRKLAPATTGRERLSLTLLAGEQALRTGHLTWAEEQARGALGAGEGGAWTVLVTAAARRDPPAALRLASEAAGAAGVVTSGGGVTTSAPLASAQELLGLAAGAGMDFETAFVHFEQARSLWQSQGEPEAVARCYVASARLKLRGVGDVNVARQQLEEVERVTLPPRCDAWAARAHLRVELLATERRTDEAAALALAAVAELHDLAAPPRQLVAAAVQALAVCSPKDRRRMLDVVLAECERMTPASARVVALDELWRIDELPGRDCVRRLDALRELLLIPTDRRLPPRDRALLKLTLAEVARLAGDRRAAIAALTAARDELRRTAPALWVRQWSLAVDRLGRRTAAERSWPAEADIAAFLEAHTQQPMLCAAFLIERAEALTADAARRLLDLAEDHLALANDEVTQWHARHTEAQARTAPRAISAGDVAAMLTTAGALFIGLGQLWRATKRRAAVPEELQESTIEIQVTGDNALSIALRPPVEPRRRRVAPDDQLVAGVLRTGDPGRFSFDFVDRWREDWIGTGVALGSLLLAPEERRRLLRAGEPRDLRIELNHFRLHALPFELARAQDTRTPLVLEPRVRCFARSLPAEVAALHSVQLLQILLNRQRGAGLTVDGQLGPRTDAAVAAALAEKGGAGGLGALRDALQPALEPGTRPLVILVRPSSDRQRADYGHGVDVGWLYESLGFDVRSIENPRVEEIRSVLASASADGIVPTVLHLSGSLRVSGGTVSLTFLAGDWYSEALEGTRYSDELSVTAVDSLLTTLPREAQPLVVLDVDRPESTTEAISHLLLRNLFAGDLFALGRCPALLATGLAGSEQGALYQELTRSLAERCTIGETASRVREVGRSAAEHTDGLEAALGPLGTALYTDVPWLRPVSR